MLLDDCKSAAKLSTIGIPRFSNSVVGRLEVPDKGKDPQPIYDKGQGIPLGHPIIDVKEVTRPIDRPDH